MKVFLLGALAFLLALPLSCGTVLVLTKSRRAEATKGWNLVPIVVAASDIPEGTALTMEQLSQRSIPEQFATGADVRPADVALVIGRKVNFALVAGDPITWSQFASLEHAHAQEDCVSAIHPAVEAAAKAAEDEVLRQVSDAPPLGEPEPLPDADFFPGERVKVVVASEDIAEGATLARTQLTTTDFPGYLVTASLVPANELDSLVGAQAVVPLQKGDAIGWVQLARPGGPETTAGCALRVDAAVSAAKREAAAREAKAWTPAREATP